METCRTSSQINFITSARRKPAHRNPHYRTLGIIPSQKSVEIRSMVLLASQNNNDVQSQNMAFSYMSPDVIQQLEQEREESRKQSMQEYQELKSTLLKRTWRFGTLFAVYLLLTVSSKAAFAELVGAAAGYGYFLWLMSDVDKYNEETIVPMREAEKIEPAILRNVAKLGAAYKQALTPRLLVPVGLVAACAAWNSTFPENTIGIIEQGCMIGGYLSFKTALILKVYDDLKPRALTQEEMLQNSRPELVEVEDVELKIKRPSERAAERAAAEDNSDTNLD